MAAARGTASGPPASAAPGSEQAASDATADRSIHGRRFVVVGRGRLTVAVGRLLLERDAAVVVVAPGHDETGELHAAVRRDGSEARASVVTASPLDRALALPEVDLRDATCLLALSDEREDNLRAAFIAARVAPDVPVVVRAFHPSLADQIECNPAGNVQRAYSMAHLSAPFFVGAALLEPEEHNLVTMRLADDYVAVCRLVVSDVGGLLRPHRRQLVGRRPQAVLAKGSCQVVARRGADGWRVCGAEDGERCVKARRS